MSAPHESPALRVHPGRSVVVGSAAHGSEAELLAACLGEGDHRVLLLRPGFDSVGLGGDSWCGWFGRASGGAWQGIVQARFSSSTPPLAEPVDAVLLEAPGSAVQELRTAVERAKTLLAEDGIVVIRCDDCSIERLRELGAEWFEEHRILWRHEILVSTLSPRATSEAPIEFECRSEGDSEPGGFWLVGGASPSAVRDLVDEVVARWHRGSRDRHLTTSAAYRRWVETAAALHQSREELAAIHRSRMWKLWMLYIDLRYGRSDGSGARRGRFSGVLAAPGRALRLLARGIRGLSRTAVGAARRTARLALRMASRAIRLLGASIGVVLLVLRGMALWAGSLFRRPGLPRVGGSESTRATPRRRPRVLMVSPYSMYPPDHGGAARVYNLIKLISEHCELHLLTFHIAGEDPVQREELERWARSVHFHRWTPALQPSFLAMTPPNAQLFSSPRVHLMIRDLVERFSIDVVQLELAELAQYIDSTGQARTILSEWDIAFRQHLRRKRLGFARKFPGASSFGSKWTDWLRLVPYEIGWARRVDLVHTMSSVDGQALARFLPDGLRRIRVAPNAVATREFERRGEEKERSVVFVGNFQNLPNLDALEYLLRDIWPLVRAVEPEATLTIVGPHLPEDDEAHRCTDQGVEVAGRIDDIRDAYHHHQVLVAPLRAGSGTRLKIVEAFAAGTAVVSTAVGCEGLDAIHGEHLIVADGPGEIAEGILTLLREPEVRRRMADSACRLAREEYDWERTAGVLLDCYRELMPAEEDAGDAGRASIRTLQDPAKADEKPLASVILPTLNGGPELESVLEAIFRQRTCFEFEVICIDSESGLDDLERMREFPVRLFQIPRASFNHGLTRDEGARLARGEVLVFLNQDALPESADWLSELVSPLLEGDEELVAMQGAMREVDDLARRFYWDSCGHRFYFTSESRSWLEQYGEVGFSTVNAAIRRSAWEKVPFGWAPVMEDKKWQREITDRGWRIGVADGAMVIHTHDYDLRSLRSRCRLEGEGWRLLGYRYGSIRALRDALRPSVWRDLARGVLRRRVRSAAELFFPVLRPLHLWRGNRGPLGRQPR